jgi:hypothetical protein
MTFFRSGETNWIPQRFFLSVQLVSSCLVVFGAVTVAVGLPVGPYSKIIWAVTGLILVFSISRRITVGWRALMGLGIALLAALVVVWPFLTARAMTSVFPDASNYVAFAQHCLRYPRSAIDGLAPIDQFALVFADSRFGTPALLSLLAEPFHDDCGLALIPFTALVIFQIFGGFALLARQFGCSSKLALIAGFAGAVYGWVSDLVCAGSLDNLLFLAIFPFCLVRLRLLRANNGSFRSLFGCSITFAASFYAYPEGLLVSGVIWLPILLRDAARLAKRSATRSKFVATLLLAIILVAPYLPIAGTFVVQQLSHGEQAEVGKGIFPGLLTDRFLPAFLALGQEFAGVPITFSGILISLFLCLLILLGIWRKRRLLLWPALLFLLLLLWQAAWKHYDYGLSKVLSAGTMLTWPATFLGIASLARFCQPRRRAAVEGLLCIFLIGSFSVAELTSRSRTAKQFVFPLQPYQDLADLKQVVGNDGIELVCDNSIDEKWASIYLRDELCVLGLPKGEFALPTVAPLLARSRRLAEPPKFLLTDHFLPNATWTNRKFWLAPIDPESPMITIGQSANEGESLQGVRFVWLSNTETTFEIEAKSDRQAVLLSDGILMGPSLPGKYKRTLVVTANGHTWRQSITDVFYSLITLKKGWNAVSLRCDDEPILKRLPNGDTRILLLGLVNYRVTLVHKDLEIVDVIHSSNRPEGRAEAPITWLSNQLVSFLIYSKTRCKALLEADNDVPDLSKAQFVARSVVVRAGGERRITVKDRLSIPVQLNAGLNRVALWLDVPLTIPRLANSDARTPFLDLANYRITQFSLVRQVSQGVTHEPN